eukprot:1908961-Prorocentrum_lima.AAC.1
MCIRDSLVAHPISFLDADSVRPYCLRNFRDRSRLKRHVLDPRTVCLLRWLLAPVITHDPARLHELQSQERRTCRAN